MLTPDEIIHLSEDQMIVFTSRTRQVLLDKFPYDKYESQRDIKPPKRTKHRVDTTSVGTAAKVPLPPDSTDKQQAERRKDRSRNKERNTEEPPPWLKRGKESKSLFDDVPDVDLDIQHDK